MRLEIEIPCCVECFEWMAPALMVEYPVPAAVWLCPNDCGFVWRGWQEDGDRITMEDKYAFAGLARMTAGLA